MKIEFKTELMFSLVFDKMAFFVASSVFKSNDEDEEEEEFGKVDDVGFCVGDEAELVTLSVR